MIPRTNMKFKKRAKNAVIFMCVIMLLINIGKIGKIIFISGEEYRKNARENQLGETQVPALRGTIYDTNMSVLATSSYSWRLCASPCVIQTDKTKADIVKQLSKMLGLDKKDLKKKIYDKDDQYEIIKKKLTASEKIEVENYIQKKGLQSILYFEADSLRYYPNDSLASTVLGHVNDDGVGVNGLESYYNEKLSGTPGRIISAIDAKQKTMDSKFQTVTDAENGTGLVLTIDATLQYYLEKDLQQGRDDNDADGCYGIMMDVKTGAILAMANIPDYDPNDAYAITDKRTLNALKAFENDEDYEQKRLDALFSLWSNDAATLCYEPGSVFKTVTLSTGLDENVIDESETYTCNGSYDIGGHNIGCVNRNGHGTQNLVTGLMNSCNPFFIHISQKIGTQAFYRYFKAFGFTEKTGVDLPAEFSPLNRVHYYDEEEFTSANLASCSFGQTFKVSPLQMLTAICAIGNGGHLMTPYVVAATVDDEKNVLSTTEPVEKRQVISESTAKRARTMMEQVVENGSGKNAYIPGYHIAGKTATSERLDDNSEEDTYVASFACFAPADDPQIALLVVVDVPRGELHGGGSVAAPIARGILEQSLKYLNVEPEYNSDEIKTLSSATPNLIGRSVSNAKQYAANQGLSTIVVGEGDMVISQIPSVSSSIPVDGVVVLYTEKNAEKKIIEVPNFSGLNFSEANSRGINAGLNVIFSGPTDTDSSIVAYRQSIDHGERVEAGTAITVYFHSTQEIAD